MTATRPTIRVLHVVNWLNPGGLENWIVDLLRHWPNDNISHEILCKGQHPGEMASQVQALGAPVHHLPMRWHDLANPLYTLRIRALLKMRYIGALHSHIGDLSVPFLKAAIAERVPNRIVSYHSTSHRISEWAESNFGNPGLLAVQAGQLFLRRQVFCGATRVLFCSAAAKDALLGDSRFRSISGVLHPSLSPDDFRQNLGRREATRESLGVGRNDFVVINVGSLEPPKNQIVIPRVAAALKDVPVRLHFLIVGSGSLYKTLSDEIRTQGVEDMVRLLGKRLDIPALLSASDLAFHPSVREGLPVSVLEYQASGLPVVASNIAAIRESLPPGDRSNGTPPDDDSGFAIRIRRLISDSEERALTAKASEDWVRSNFSTQQTIRELSSLYLENASDKGRPS